MSMGRRPRKGGEEMDVFSGWRYLLGYTNWAGLVSGVKKRVRRAGSAGRPGRRATPMTDDELKSIVESYIVEGVESDAGDCLHEMDSLYDGEGELDEDVYRRSLSLWRTAKVSVVWDD